MKSVSYTTYTKLSCGCDAPVIVCVDDALVASGAPYIEATVAFSDSVIDSCKVVKYRYAVTYDEGQLTDPYTPLIEADIGGIVCRGCLTTFIEYLHSLARFTGKGTTVNRPTLTVLDVGCTYMDTTLDADGLPIWWNGTKWIKADGSDA